MHTGSIIDFYDDPNGHVLKTKLAEEQVPVFIKTAQFLGEQQRERLPDDVFALVMIDQGSKLRKYACVDKGNAALSVIYFLENKDKLPEEAQKVAAANLLTACKWYDIQPPAPLMKIAGPYHLGKKRGKDKTAGLGTAANLGMQGLYVKGVLDEGLARHAKAVGPKASGMRSMMPKIGDLSGSNVMPLSSDTEKTAGILQPDLPRARDVIKGRGPAKRAERSALRDKLRSTHPAGKPFLGDKMASVMYPYVDVTGKSAPERFEKVAHQRFALVKEGQNRFPIDSYGDVLEADRWFNDHGESLHPEDRRTMCTKLAARADEIGCKVTDYVKKYAGVGYAPDGEVRVAVSTRMQYFQDDSPERDMLHGLMDKYAHVPPDVFCEAVRQFDEATGLDYHWDDGVYDPWYTTYGFTKTAEWEFSTHGDKINEERLKQVVNASYPYIKERFGDDMADSLKKSPVQIFDSLPLDTKRIIMRMANDPQPSPVVLP